MSRINTNIASIRSINNLNHSNADLQVRLARLSSGLRINAAKDDPAGLIASETLRAEMAGIGQAINNSERASSVIATAEGALNEVSSLLLGIKSLVTASANEGAIAPEEIKANQLQIDSAIDSINRIANSTVFEGVKLVDGSLDFTTSGADAADITNLRLNQVRFGTASSINVNVNVIDSAQVGQLEWSGTALTTDITLEIAGYNGVEVFSFASSTSLAGIVSAINKVTDITGISARTSATITLGGNEGILLASTEYGSQKFVSVKTESGTFTTYKHDAAVAAILDEGVDATVSVNGIQAVSEGLDIQVNSPTVSFDAIMTTTLNAGGTTSFAITGGGAQFQLGPQVNAQQMAIVGIQSVASHRLGNAASGYLRDIRTEGTDSIVGKNYQDADNIVNAAIQQVAKLRGRLGAFQKNTLDTNINSLNVALENVTASESAIRDADFARETAALTRGQILVQAGTSVLSIANASPQNVLALLG
ncbi:MAG: flagellin [Planctomycetes bacterium]|nr:flagellin [Planctomycetota bacterium]